MRTQETVIDSILDFANACEDVVIVMMNGSRVNPEVKKDLMQDYDIVFFIDGDDFEKYKADRHWIRQFGETIIVQQNDFDENSYIFLMQFADGVRIDLRFSRRIAYESVLAEDTLNVILLDKTESLQPLPPPSDEKHQSSDRAKTTGKSCSTTLGGYRPMSQKASGGMNFPMRSTCLMSS